MIGSRLAHYEITNHLGTGGMGEVYQATDSKLRRNVALKFLPEAFARDVDRVSRFEREDGVVLDGKMMAVPITADGRFLIDTAIDENLAPITVVLNWKPPQ
jgi:serine/threonine protein kinase